MSSSTSSLGQTLARWSNDTPEALFLREADSERDLSYGSAMEAVSQFQRLIGPARRTVVLALPGSIPAAVVWLAALGGGHRLVLCSPDASEEEKARLAALYTPDLAVVERVENRAGLRLDGGRVITVEQMWDSVLSPASGGIRTSRSPSEVEGEVSLTTSGTTGAPKGVTLRADQVAWTADQVRLSHRLTPRDRGLSVLPFFHINAPVVSLSATLLAGASLVIAPRFSRSRFWDWIHHNRVTWASVVPTIVSHLLQAEKPEWLPGRLRFVRTASAPLPAVWLAEFENRFGIPVIETYGLSEAASQVAANPVPPGLHRAGSVGLPTGVKMRICEPGGDAEAGTLRDVEPGSEGEICIAGPSVIQGYDGGAGADSFAGEWFRTGDLGRFDRDGYLFITGRIRDVINRGGEKISPREVEEVLLAHPAVRDAVVVAEPDPVYGQRAVAYLVPSAPGTSDLEASLRVHASARLARFKVPSRFVVVQDLPRTRTGKVRRGLILSGEQDERPVRAA